MINEESKIEAIPDVMADKTRVCEIRFDCMVTMHDMGIRKYKDALGFEKHSKHPQWFRAQHKLTLETVKYMDEFAIGSAVKQMFRELENTIKKYEQS